jgi:hypothetical protein
MAPIIPVVVVGVVVYLLCRKKEVPREPKRGEEGFNKDRYWEIAGKKP